MGRLKKAKSSKAKKSKSGGVAKVAKSALGAITGGRASTGRKSRKKSAGWYAKEIARLKLKKRYNKVKYGVNI